MKCWSAENIHVFLETLLHPVKIGAWCAMSGRRIIRPKFFEETVIAQRYGSNVLNAFFQELQDDEFQEGLFQIEFFT